MLHTNIPEPEEFFIYFTPDYTESALFMNGVWVDVLNYIVMLNV